MTSFMQRRFVRKIKYNLQEVGLGAQAVPPEQPELLHLQKEFEGLQRRLGSASHNILHNFAVESRGLHAALRGVYGETSTGPVGGAGGGTMDDEQMKLLNGLNLTLSPGPLPLVENQSVELSQVLSLFSSAVSQQIEAEIQQVIDMVKRREVSAQELHHYELKLQKVGGGQPMQPMSTAQGGIERFPSGVPGAVATVQPGDGSSGGSMSSIGEGAVPTDLKVLAARSKLDSSRRAHQALVAECQTRMVNLKTVLNQRLTPLVTALLRAEAAWLFDAGSALLSQVLPQGTASSTARPTIANEVQNLQRLLAAGGVVAAPPMPMPTPTPSAVITPAASGAGVSSNVGGAGVGVGSLAAGSTLTGAAVGAAMIAGQSQQASSLQQPQQQQPMERKLQDQELQRLHQQQEEERATSGAGISAAAAMLGTGHLDTGKPDAAHHLHGTSVAGSAAEGQGGQQLEGVSGGVPPHYWASRSEPGAGGMIQHDLQGEGAGVGSGHIQQRPALGSVVTKIPPSVVAKNGPPRSSPLRPEPLPKPARGKGHQHIRTTSLGGIESLPFSLNPPSEIIPNNTDSAPHVTLCRIINDLTAPPNPSSDNPLMKRGFSLKTGELVLAEGDEARWKKVARDRDARMTGELDDAKGGNKATTSAVDEEENKSLRIFAHFGPSFCPQSALAPVFGVLESAPYRIKTPGVAPPATTKVGIPDEESITRSGGVLRMLVWTLGKVDPRVASTAASQEAEVSQPSQPTLERAPVWHGGDILESLGLHVRNATSHTLDLASSSLLPCEPGDELHILESSPPLATEHYEKLRALDAEEGEGLPQPVSEKASGAGDAIHDFLLCRRRFDGRLGFVPLENCRLGSSPVMLEATESAMMVTPRSVHSQTKSAGFEGGSSVSQQGAGSSGLQAAEPSINYATPSNATAGQATAVGQPGHIHQESPGLAMLHALKAEKQHPHAVAGAEGSSQAASASIPTLQVVEPQ